MSGPASELLRLYLPEECGPKGYPVPWESGEPRIPELVRELAGHRCIRCRHPFICGETTGEWSPCDKQCKHNAPLRRRQFKRDPWQVMELLPPAIPGELNLRLSAGQRVRSEELIEAHWRVLTVHHLTGDKLDCRWWNLAALCQRCHLEIQGRVRMEQIYAGEHSEWFKPYAAGYYAWTYLGEELSREETLQRLAELLALERAK